MNQIIKKEALDCVIQQIKFYQLRITFEAIEDIHLSEYKGSAFRGCLGDAFRHEVCRFPKKKCEACPLEYDCEFAALFEAPLPAGHHLFGKYTHPPRPYLIIPMPGKETIIIAGNEFYFDLILIGSAIRLLSTLIRVFQLMGKLGIGTGYSKFKALRIEHFSPIVGFQPLPVFGLPFEIMPDQFIYQQIDSTLNLVFQHPIRFIKARKPYKDPPPFEMMIENLSRRMTLLAHLYCQADWVDTDRAFDLEGKVKIKMHQLEWKDWTRYSGTKEMNMCFDGHLGTISYEGELTPWLKMLQLGTWLHAGSTATFGLGKYTIVSD